LNKKKDIVDINTLVEAATKVGILDAREFLESNELTEKVRQNVEKNVERNVSGVPFFIIDEKYAVSGAQNPDVFLDIFKKVGLGFQTPADAIHSGYVDKKCPFTGNVSIRGRILRGMVISTKMNRTIIMRRDYLHYIRKYSRYEKKRHTNIPVHCSPAFKRIKEGDIVTIGQCRPLSKTVRFNVLKVQSNQIFGSVKKQFMLF